MIKITANHSGVEKTLSISEWSVITGCSPQSIRGRYISVINHNNETIVGFVKLNNSVIDNNRDKNICSLYIDGLSQREISEKYNVSTSRIKQILKRNDVGYSKSGLRKAIADKKAELITAKENKIVGIFECTRKKWRFYRSFDSNYNKTPLVRYKQQRKNAKDREIEWMFTIDTWWDVWEKSGKYHLRGKTLGHYVMSRKNDIGAYSPENVEIKTCSENIIEGYGFRGGKYKAS